MQPRNLDLPLLGEVNTLTNNVSTKTVYDRKKGALKGVSTASEGLEGVLRGEFENRFLEPYIDQRREALEPPRWALFFGIFFFSSLDRLLLGGKGAQDGRVGEGGGQNFWFG